ncbi:MAG: hypothetical protein JWR01_2934 [Subtercola sp.]|nr:hypothetical protein [Subtercola sp.]
MLPRNSLPGLFIQRNTEPQSPLLDMPDEAVSDLRRARSMTLDGKIVERVDTRHIEDSYSSLLAHFHKSI